MPANLTPEYYEAEKRWRSAQNLDEKIDALQDMLSTIPKHKGTEKMQGDIKQRLAKAREQKETRAKKSVGKRRPDWVVQRQGCGQVVVAGPANSGKSSLVAALTNAEPEIGDYPFSTVMPAPAMLDYKNVQIQLVDLPPLHPDMSPSWLPQVIQAANAVLLVLDASDDDILSKTTAALQFLQDKNLPLRCPEHSGEKQFLGQPPEEDEEPRISYPAMVVLNKNDRDGAEIRHMLLQEMWQEEGLPYLPAVTTSVKSDDSLADLPGKIWHLLGKVRVYTRPPGREPDFSAPFVLDRGSTALDLARTIHKEVGRTFKYARVWGDNTFDAQRVGRDYVLSDGDVLEVHSAQ